jgi:transposase
MEIHCFEGNKAETLTMLPVIRAFLARHNLSGLTVVTDAAMLSADNLEALEDAGLIFIVADRIRKVPYEIDDHIARHGNHFSDGQTFETTRTMGTGTHARRRWVIYQYRRKRERLDLRNINKQIAKAEKMIDGTRPVKKDRFVKLTSKKMVLDSDLIDAARARAGIKGYVTNLTDLPATTVIDAYHALSRSSGPS